MRRLHLLRGGELCRLDDAHAHPMDLQASGGHVAREILWRISHKEPADLVRVTVKDCLDLRVGWVRVWDAARRRWHAPSDDKVHVRRAGQQEEGDAPASVEEGQADAQLLGDPQAEAVPAVRLVELRAGSSSRDAVGRGRGGQKGQVGAVVRRVRGKSDKRGDGKQTRRLDAPARRAGHSRGRKRRGRRLWPRL